METSEILRAIVAHCTDEKLVLWAAREMQRKSHTPVSLAVKYRQVLSTGSMPDDAAKAMQAACATEAVKGVSLHIRLTNAEHERLHANAQEAGMTVSDYVRSRCL